MNLRTKMSAALVGGALLTGGLAMPALADTPVISGGTCRVSSVNARDIVTAATKSVPETVQISASCDPVTYTCPDSSDTQCLEVLSATIEADGAWDQVEVNPDTGVVDTYVVPTKLDRVTGQFTFSNGAVSKAWVATGSGPNYTVVRPFDYGDRAGLTKVTVRAYEAGAVVGIKSDTFYVRRNAKIDGFNSGPEGRLVNSSLKSSGKLTRLTETGKYVGWSGKTVTIDFKAAGSGSWVKVGTDLTSSTGYFEKTVRTKNDGHWRARAAGTNYTYGPISGADYVNVTNYANCSAVPTALKPLTRTEPGYEPRLDGDNDGEACER